MDHMPRLPWPTEFVKYHTFLIIMIFKIIPEIEKIFHCKIAYALDWKRAKATNPWNTLSISLFHLTNLRSSHVIPTTFKTVSTTTLIYGPESKISPSLKSNPRFIASSCHNHQRSRISFSVIKRSKCDEMEESQLLESESDQISCRWGQELWKIFPGVDGIKFQAKWLANCLCIC